MTIRKWYKKLWYVPIAPVILVNMTLLLIILVMNYVGKAIVWVNNHVSEAGDWLHDQTGDTKPVDRIIHKMIDRGVR